MKYLLALTSILFSINSFSQDCIDSTLINPNCICILIIDPVCGCDGIEYTNSCFAECAGVTSYQNAYDENGNSIDCQSIVDEISICDSINISPSNPTLSFVDQQAFVSIDISTNYYSDITFPYCGFILINESGDTIAMEDINFAGNVYGLGSQMNETRNLLLNTPLASTISGTLQLINGYFSGNGELACEFPFTIEIEEDNSIVGQWYSAEEEEFLEFTTDSIFLYAVLDSCYEYDAVAYFYANNVLSLNFEDGETVNFDIQLGENTLDIVSEDTMSFISLTFDPTNWIECEGSDCEIYGVFAETYECDSAGYVMIDVEFEYENPEANEFEIFCNDNTYGPFEYGEPFYTIGPILADSSTYYEITVSDLESDCTDSYELGIIDCSVCKIYDVYAEAGQCDSAGYVMITIDFVVQNPEAAQFKLSGNGTNYGTFSYGQDYYEIGPLAGDGETNYEFLVNDLEDFECYNYYELGIINCDDFSSIHELKQSKKLMYVRNLLGEKVEFIKYNTPLFYFYDDGTVERKLILK